MSRAKPCNLRNMSNQVKQGEYRPVRDPILLTKVKKESLSHKRLTRMRVREVVLPKMKTWMRHIRTWEPTSNLSTTRAYLSTRTLAERTKFWSVVSATREHSDSAIWEITLWVTFHIHPTSATSAEKVSSSKATAIGTNSKILASLTKSGRTVWIEPT